MEDFANTDDKYKEYNPSIRKVARIIDSSIDEDDHITPQEVEAAVVNAALAKSIKLEKLEPDSIEAAERGVKIRSKYLGIGDKILAELRLPGEDFIPKEEFMQKLEEHRQRWIHGEDTDKEASKAPWNRIRGSGSCPYR